MSEEEEPDDWYNPAWSFRRLCNDGLNESVFMCKYENLHRVPAYLVNVLPRLHYALERFSSMCFGDNMAFDWKCIRSNINTWLCNIAYAQKLALKNGFISCK